jgi:hypothetical protein
LHDFFGTSSLTAVEGDRLAWLDDGETIHVIPLPAEEDPVAALRGSARGKRLTERLLQSRREDREHGA